MRRVSKFSINSVSFNRRIKKASEDAHKQDTVIQIPDANAYHSCLSNLVMNKVYML